MRSGKWPIRSHQCERISRTIEAFDPKVVAHRLATPSVERKTEAGEGFCHHSLLQASKSLTASGPEQSSGPRLNAGRSFLPVGFTGLVELEALAHFFEPFLVDAGKLYRLPLPLDCFVEIAGFGVSRGKGVEFMGFLVF